MFFNISLKSNGKWIILVFVITVIILLVSMFFMISLIDKIQNGDVFYGELDLSFKNYYTEYDMTVISNKNVHTYNVKEWYKEGVKTKLEYLDYMKNIVTITLETNTCNISNSGNIAKLVINNMIDNKNISSLSTFGYLYNVDCNNCECNKSKHIKGNETIVTISFKQTCNCGCNKVANEIGVGVLELILVDNLPKNYTVYDKNKKEYISIVYNVFEQNIEM